MWKSCISLLIISQLLHQSVAYVVSVEAHGEECFFERAEQGTKMGLMFEVIEGGFLDIDVSIIGPDGTAIHTGEKESNGKYAFSATKPGVYSYCFNNKMSTMSPKVIMFSMDIEEPPKGTPGAIKEDQVGQANLESMIRELAGTLIGVKHEQEYMHVRDKIHRSINDNTNFRVVVWSTFEALVLVFMTVGQVYYLKRFFEVRRVV